MSSPRSSHVSLRPEPLAIVPQPQGVQGPGAMAYQGIGQCHQRRRVATVRTTGPWPLSPATVPWPLYLGHCPLPTVHWPMDHNDIPWLLQVRRMFLHAYHGYAKYAFPLDELKPKSCRGEDTLGGYALTLVSLLQPPCTEHCHHCNILPATPCSWQNLTQDRNQDWSQEWSVPCGPSCN